MSTFFKIYKTHHFSKIPVLLLFAVILFIMSCSSTKKVMKDDLINIHESNSTVASFVNYVNENNKMTPDHMYISNALIKLAEAENAMAGEINYGIKGDLMMAKAHAKSITNNHNEATHADDIRKSADILTGILQNMQLEKYPSLSTASSQLKTAAEAINPQILTRNQKQAIMEFFSQSASILQKMN